MDKNHRQALAVAALLSMGLLAGCNSSEPAPPTPESTEAVSEGGSAASDAAEAEGDNGEVQEEVATQPEIPDVEFTLDNAQSDQHGVEVGVSFTFEGSVETNEGNVVRAVSRAVEVHPDYDLIIVRGYGAGSGPSDSSPTIEAWFKPENVRSLDLNNPAQSEPYKHCYSCHVPGQHHR